MVPVALTIAGSDSGGGAGIQADLKTFHSFAVFGTTAVTAVTVQNTIGVSAVHPVPVEIVVAQIRAVAEDLPPAALKTGMLATSGLVRAVGAAIEENHLRNFVLDPVMVATSGDRLLDRDAEQTIVEVLVPRATLVTPNLDEAGLLAGLEVRDLDGMRRAAAILMERGAAAVLIKGGHLDASEVTDVLFDGHEWYEWRRPKLRTRSTHGTGCTLSAAITAGLAHGRSLTTAVEEALDYVHRALESAPRLGHGHGPLNHFVAARPEAEASERGPQETKE